MSLKDLIYEKWKEAFKARDEKKRTCYEFLKQRILVAEKSGQFTLPLTDNDVINLIIKEYKERKDLLTVYSEADEEYIQAQFIVNELEQYLPKQLSEEEVCLVISRLKETETNVGKLIGLVVKEVGNSFDKSKIAGLVRRELQ